MNFKEISQKMKESKLVRFYIYLWIVAIILFGIGIFVYLTSQKIFSFVINLLVSIAFVVIVSIGFLFRARFLLLAGFIEGNKPTIKFQIGGVIVVLLAVLVFYKRFVERWGIFFFFALLVVGILVIIFDFLRLRELK